MPTQRKRIGFLPRSEVHKIIDQISKHNKFSQSKVTGILVEEALKSRGIINSSIKKLSFNFCTNNNNLELNNKENLYFENNEEEDCVNLDEQYIREEVQMINDFIEFKFFKKMMNKNKKHNI